MHIYGRNPVLEALRAGEAIEKIYILHGARGGAMDEIFALAKRRGVAAAVTPKEKFFALLAGGEKHAAHQGVIARTSDIAYAPLEGIVSRAVSAKENALLVLLDEISDPHNFGAIVRTAECAGAHGVVTLKHHSAPITAAVVKASAGAAQHIPIARVANLAQTIESLKKENIWVVGADAEGTSDYTAYDFTAPVAIVIGAEGRGLRQLVKSKCDSLVKIPLHGKVSSLNASVAAGVLLFEARRQRGNSEF